ncbi:MAG: trypsin-like peptidase domain-containing protein [Bdellovibrionales bacterium]|nr:trypsin-like peptidase domain-containing protein [Bdellovibrionales bacterium]
MLRIAFVTILAAPLACAAPGFLPANHESIPQPVRAAYTGIFRIVTRSTRPTALVPKDSFKRYEQALPQTYSGFALLLKRAEFSAVRDAGEEQAYLSDWGVGTAFFIDERTLVSAKHVFSEARAYPPVVDRQAPVSFYLFDKQNRKVFQSNPDVPNYEILFSGEIELHTLWGDRYAGLDKASQFELLDVVILRLHGQLPKLDPLKWAGSKPDVGELLYAPGFPNKSLSRNSEFGIPDSDGNGFYVATGKRIPIQESYRSFLYRTLEREDANAYIATKLFHDVDTIAGNSGGPLLNGKGEVAGVIGSHFDHPKLTPAERYYPGGGYAMDSGFFQQVFTNSVHN